MTAPMQCGLSTAHVPHYFWAADGIRRDVCVGVKPVSEPLQQAVDLAEMLAYAATLAVPGKPATAYIAMLASIKGELTRLFDADLGSVAHNPLPAPSQAPSQKESS